MKFTHLQVILLCNLYIYVLYLFREMSHIKSNPINESQHTMDEAMVQCHKHVFLADKIQECVQEHVLFQVKKDQIEPLVAPRLFIIYDNVEASEPGDTSDYCAVLDAPFYKLRIEDCKESGKFFCNKKFFYRIK